MSGVISVTLSLSGGTSTNDIIVTVIPSDQSPVSAEGKILISQTTSFNLNCQVMESITILLQSLPPLLLELIMLQSVYH